jgi:hypothetical protein
MRSYYKSAKNIGPLALVLPPDKIDLVERVLDMLAVRERPMKVFMTPAPALRWIEEQRPAISA